MSIITFEKPVPNVAESDWYFKVSELKDSCVNYRHNTFELKNESHRLRNETDTTTYWSTHHSNSELINRRTEITRWKKLFEIYLEKLQKEIEDMKSEKKQTEQVLEFLNLNFSVTNHCLTIREERRKADLCYDDAYIELKNEQRILEHLKNSLSEMCQTAWEQINKLEELRINILRDLDNKNNTIKIDTELLEMTKDSTNITLKPDPLRVQIDICTYEKWLQRCNNLKQRFENEFILSKKLRETMYVPRHKTKNNMQAQNDNVNHALRRRIYDTERLKNELEWQKLNMVADMETFSKEIENLENALDRKLNSIKLVETRCEERLFRVGDELCHDKSTIGLLKENFHLENTTKSLTEKLTQTKTMYHLLTDQLNLIKEELVNKTHALMVDQKCLEHRAKLQGRR